MSDSAAAAAPHLDAIKDLVAAKTAMNGGRRRRTRGRKQYGGVSDTAAISAAKTISEALGQSGGRRRRSRRLRKRSGKSRRHTTRSHGGKRKRSTHRRKRMSGGLVLM